MRAPSRPILDKNLAPIGPGILSSIGAEVWRKAPGVCHQTPMLYRMHFSLRNDVSQKARVVNNFVSQRREFQTIVLGQLQLFLLMHY